MSTSNRFWKVAFSLLILALFYIGHGLNGIARRDTVFIDEAMAQKSTVPRTAKQHGPLGDKKAGWDKTLAGPVSMANVLTTWDSTGTVLHFWHIPPAPTPDGGIWPIYLCSKFVSPDVVRAHTLQPD